MNVERVKYSIRKNDQVQVISGRDKGKTGKVLHVNRENGRVTIEKVNMVKRHTKGNQANPGGGILEKELPLDYSNVQLFCAKCNRGVRHGQKLVAKKSAKGAEGAKKKMMKVRVCKRCGEQLDAA